MFQKVFNIYCFLNILLFNVVACESVSTSTKCNLLYFDARGAAELSRVLMKVGGLQFEDYRFPIIVKETGGFETIEYTAKKTEGIFAVNMDRVPVLELSDGKLIGQSRAIERYVAVKCGLMGCSDEERAMIDCIVENIRDIKDKWGKIRMTGGFGTNPEKEKLIDSWFNGGEFIEWLEKLEKSLPLNIVSDLAIGNTISYADISIWNLLKDNFNDYQESMKLVEQKIKNMKLFKIANQVHENPQIKTWLSERPKTMF